MLNESLRLVDSARMYGVLDGSIVAEETKPITVASGARVGCRAMSSQRWLSPFYATWTLRRQPRRLARHLRTGQQSSLCQLQHQDLPPRAYGTRHSHP
jgi:hypothetical protein